MKACFVTMPITRPSSGPYEDADHFLSVLEYLFKPAIIAAGLDPISPVHKGSEVIHSDIVRNLYEADFVLCDMSSLNPNVFFEFGIRCALNKPVCLVADEVTRTIPFDTGIINRHTYPTKLRFSNIESERERLAEHIRTTVAKSDGRNALWRHFGIAASGDLSKNYTLEEKLDHLFQMLSGLAREAAPQVPKPSFDLPVHGRFVQEWAMRNKARDPFNMGPLNWDRCLYDLGLAGGVYRELLHDEQGNLVYR